MDGTGRASHVVVCSWFRASNGLQSNERIATTGKSKDHWKGTSESHKIQKITLKTSKHHSKTPKRTMHQKKHKTTTKLQHTRHDVALKKSKARALAEGGAGHLGLIARSLLQKLLVCLRREFLLYLRPLGRGFSRGFQVVFLRFVLFWDS